MADKDPNKVCEDCIKETRTVYKYDGPFFEPGLHKINHLQLGYSPMMRNPLLLAAEWLYLQYTKLRNAWRGLLLRLFPRDSKCRSRHIDSHLTGRTCYAHREEFNEPIRGLHTQFWARTWWGQWRKMGDAYCDEDGYFRLPFELRAARRRIIRHLFFEIYQTTRIYHQDKQPVPVLERCYRQQIKKSDLTGMTYNLRSIHLYLWEYRRDSVAPRAVIRDVNHDAPQYYAQGRVDAMIEQIMPFEFIKFKHLEQIANAPETITLADIQNDYPENLTVCIEKQLPGYTRTDAWFGERMMNGMNRGYFEPDKSNDRHYWIRYFGICNYEHNTEYALPTVEVKFEVPPDQLPVPLEIHLTGPLNAYDKNPWQKKVIKKDDGDVWTYAKRVVRVTGAFSTEVDEHFTGTHLNVEQYAIAAYRNFRRSPLACLLFPHLKEVALVNHSADTLLIHQYIPSATALTEEGLKQRCVDILGVQDWKSWKPMKSLGDAHACARAEKLFWEITTEFVERFFADNASDIQKYWYEVYYFSKDLVEHAVPVFLSDIHTKEYTPEEDALNKARRKYYAKQYGFDYDLPRVVVNNQLKAVSPVTHALNFAETAPDDWANLQQLCVYAIMMATYMHTWINERQYDDLGEVLYSSGGLRFGMQQRGILAPESDLSIAPDLTRATQMLWFTNFLSRTEYGMIVRDEEGDVNPIFKDMLMSKQSDFEKFGVDINAIESRTNI
jgi:hypothetical protein